MIRTPLIIAFICVIVLSLIQPSLSQCSFKDTSSKDFCIQLGSTVPTAAYDKISNLMKNFPHMDIGPVDNLVPPFSIYANAFWSASTEATVSSLGLSTGIMTLYSLGNSGHSLVASDKSQNGGYQDIIDVYLASSGQVCVNYFVKSYSTETTTKCTTPSFDITSNQWYTIGAFFDTTSVTIQVYHNDGTDSYYHSESFTLPKALPTSQRRNVVLGLPPLGKVTTSPPFLDEFRALKRPHTEAEFEALDNFFARPTEYSEICESVIVWYPFNDYGVGSSPYFTAKSLDSSFSPVQGRLGNSAKDEDGNIYTNNLALGKSISFQVSPAPNSDSVTSKRSHRFNKEKRNALGNYDCYGWGDPHITPFMGQAAYTYGAQTGKNYAYTTRYATPTCAAEGVYKWANCTVVGFVLYTGNYISSWSYTVNGYGSILYGTNTQDQFDFFVGNCHASKANYVTLNGVQVSANSKTLTSSTGVSYKWTGGALSLTANGVSVYIAFNSAIYADITISFSSPCQPVGQDGICASKVVPLKECQYGEWSDCSASCAANNIIPTRTRYLVAGTDCATSQVEYCNNKECGCYYADWTACSTSCNNGYQTRALKTSISGASCARTNTQGCMIKECDCYYTEWTDCTKQCNTGYQTRTKKVNISGYSCTEKQTQKCNTQTCPSCVYVDSDPACSPTCGAGATKYFYATAAEKEWCSDFTVPCNVSCDTNECENYNYCDLTTTSCENVVCDSPSCFGTETYNCNCLDGYERSYSDEFDGSYGCTDIDECSDDDLNDCDEDATCYNTAGSYYCVCNEDYLDQSANLDGTKCFPNCNQTEWSDCIGVCDGIGTKTRTTVPNLVDDSRCAPLSETCDMAACEPIPDVTCDLSTLGTDYETKAKAACSCVDAEAYPDLYTSCLLDLCFGQDLTIAASHCSVSQEECLRELLRDASLDPTTEADPSDCPNVCINSCNGHGYCNESIGCVCDDGYTGIDCRNPENYYCLTATWNDIDRPIAGYIYEFGAVMEDADVKTYFQEKSLQVKDSVLIYFLESVEDTLTYNPVHHLMIINDHSDSDTDGGSYKLTITKTSGTFSVTSYIGDGATLNSDWTSVDMSWSAYPSPRSGMAVTSLPDDFCIDIDVTNVGTGVDQLLFGTGTGSITSSAFEVMKVPFDSTTSSFATITICSSACKDSCSNYTTCETCAADSACGWCRDSGECQTGKATGPTRGECQNWRYTFDSTVSRRLTLALDYPMHYDDVEVFLTDEPSNAADLPQSLSIDVIAPDEIVWDVIIAVPENRPSFMNSITNSFEEIVTKLRNFPTLDISIVSYYSEKAEVHNIMTSSWQLISDFKATISSIASSSSDDTKAEIPTLLATLAGSSLDLGWRSNARKALLLFADLSYASTGTISDHKLAILNGGYYPIFIVPSSLVSTYQTLVDDLEFGSVITFSEDTVASSCAEALTLASTTVSLVITEAGHIDETLKEDSEIHGLSAGMRARFTYVLKHSAGTIETAELIAPGFGSVTVESIESDAPGCEYVTIVVDEDSIDPTVGERGILVTLGGYTYKDYPIYYKITALPATGSIYQWTSSSTFKNYEITSVDTIVYDIGGRIVYIPPEYSQSVNSMPYATIEYESNDLCTDSLTCVVAIYLNPLANAPVATSFNISVAEDQVASFDMAEYKMDHDLTDPNGEEQATTWAVQSNLYSLLQWSNAGSDAIALNTYSSVTTFYVNPTKNLNGQFTFDWLAKDTTDLYSTPAKIYLTITPVNDAPTVTGGSPAVGRMNEWFTISVTAADVDSAQFTLSLTVPEGFLGTLVDSTNATLEGGETFVSSGTAEVPRAATTQFSYKAPNNAYSCDLINDQDKNCTVANNTYTYFTVSVTDGEGATSGVLTINIIILNTDTAPTLASHNGTIYMYEDTAYTDTYAGIDVDTSLISSYIVDSPVGITVYQYPQSDNVLLDTTGLITDSSSKVVLVPPTDVYGDADNNFYYAYLTYRIYDGLFYSDTQHVKIHLIPVNDAPVPVTSSVSTNEDTLVVITLFATDLDNEIEDLTFKITSLLAESVGAFYQYDASAELFIGDKIESTGTVVPVQECTTYTGQVVTAACFVFYPATLTYGKNTFSYSVTDVDTYSTSSVNTVSQDVELEVIQVNHAPIAEMSNPSISEDTLTVITLGYWDLEEDAVVYRITSAPTEGTLYQYTTAVAEGDTSVGVKIDTSSGEVNVTDSDGRVIYVPPTNKNSETSQTYLYYVPEITYYVSETNPAVAPIMSSGTTTITIFIYGVNDAPFVWDEAGAPYSWTVSGDATCYSDCTFEEDFGAGYLLTVGTRKISLGGYDVEWDTLTVVVESISCPDSINTQFWDISSGNEISQSATNTVVNSTLTVSGDSTTGYNTMKILLAFTPYLDQHSFTCTIKYKVFDGELYSAESKSITIDITPVNDPPRILDEAQTTFTTIENTPISFTPELYDIENDAFTAKVISIANSDGVFSDVNGNALTVDSTLSGTSADTTNWKITFTPPTDENGAPMNYITLAFDDGQEWDPIKYVTYYVNVYAINQGPTFTVNYTNTLYGPDSDISYPIAVSSSSDISLWNVISVEDIDAGARKVACNISATSGTFSMQITSTVSYTTDTTNTYYYIKASTTKLTELLNTLTWIPEDGVDSANITIYVNDMGYTGYCVDDSGAVSETGCEKGATIFVTVTIGSVADQIAIVALASGAAAAGAILIGLLGALLFRRLSDEASSAEFQPWDDASFGNVANVNPLFESAEIGGSSPIYESANNTDYVAMSG